MSITLADPFNAQRESMAAIIPMRSVRESMAAMDPMRSVRESMAAFGTELADSAESLVEPDSAEWWDDWLRSLPDARERRIFIASMWALSAVTNLIYAEVGLVSPAHLDMIIEALLAIATVLSEYLEPRRKD